MSKVRGIKIAEYNYAGSKFAIVRLADSDDENEMICPGSDQADALLRIEQLAELLDCEPEGIEEACKELLDIEAAAKELLSVMEVQAQIDAAKEQADRVSEIFGDEGSECVFVLGTDDEIEEMLRQAFKVDE
jgi:hypothetical protein